ncbi:hypothetical protein [Micromonospora sp. DPT]|uniref:hypothetical protein n=1 Tax=Micromonospora sp. DPT TaxID=3142975 RepID=UPI0032088572
MAVPGRRRWSASFAALVSAAVLTLGVVVTQVVALAVNAVRVVALPAAAVEAPRGHLAEHVEDGPEGEKRNGRVPR